MSQIVPTITAENPHVYRDQIERVQGFAKRIHIDLMDGIFTPNKSIGIENVWWSEDIVADIHLMFQNPQEQLEILLKLKPNLVTIHAESDCSFLQFAEKLTQNDIKCGVALLPETSVESLGETIQHIQHLLIFSGNLGYQGGSVANLDLLEKVTKAKDLNPELEIAWDGGINETNTRALAAAGVEVLNVGGYIHAAPDAGLAYKALTELLP